MKEKRAPGVQKHEIAIITLIFVILMVASNSLDHQTSSEPNKSNESTDRSSAPLEETDIRDWTEVMELLPQDTNEVNEPNIPLVQQE